MAFEVQWLRGMGQVGGMIQAQMWVDEQQKTLQGYFEQLDQVNQRKIKSSERAKQRAEWERKMYKAVS
jgi:hypothetical protein